MKFLCVTFLTLLFAISAFAQDCHHASDIERWEQIRVTYPGKVTSFTGKTLDIVMEDGKEVRATSIEIDPDTKLPDNFQKDWKSGLWIVVFCATHPKHIYQVLPYKK